MLLYATSTHHVQHSYHVPKKGYDGRKLNMGVQKGYPIWWYAVRATLTPCTTPTHAKRGISPRREGLGYGVLVYARVHVVCYYSIIVFPARTV